MKNDTKRKCVPVITIGYALVICNHGPPLPGEGRGIAVEMSGVFTFALSPQCGGNTRDLCYIGKKRRCNENITDCGGKLPWFYQLTVPAV